MVLTDREIQAAIQHGHIVVEPPPSELAYSSTSLDLTLSDSINVWKREPVAGVERSVSPATDGFKYTDFLRNYSEPRKIGNEGYIADPGAFLLGWTVQRIALPVESRIAARVEGKSSLARLGIGVHVTAPIIHAGFNGSIQLEICNHGPLHVKLLPGMRICQLVFEQTLGTPEKGYAGQFSGQAAT